jgi:hypothetical protein
LEARGVRKHQRFQAEAAHPSNARTTREGVKLKINSKDFRVPPDKKVKLDEWPTTVENFFKSTEQYQELLAAHIEGLSSRQQLHYASGRYGEGSAGLNYS